MEALDFRTPVKTRTIQKQIDPNNPDAVIEVQETYIPLRQLTDEDLAQLAANEAQNEPIGVHAARRDRNMRNQLLFESDWINQPDVTMSDEKKAEWVAYRQALRDISSHENWPDLAPDDWPTQPT